MIARVHMCQYEDTDLLWHDAIRITSYGEETKDTIIDLETHERVIMPANIENNEENGCFIY